MNTKVQIKVIGIGNIDREDDGVGHVIAESLKRLHPNWNVSLVRQLLPEMVAWVSDCDQLIFVDAAVDLMPGIVVLDQVSAATTTLISHQMAPAQLMTLAELIRTGHASTSKLPDAWCVKIGVGRLGFGRQLSADVQASVEVAIEAVERIALNENATSKRDYYGQLRVGC